MSSIQKTYYDMLIDSAVSSPSETIYSSLLNPNKPGHVDPTLRDQQLWRVLEELDFTHPPIDLYDWYCYWFHYAKTRPDLLHNVELVPGSPQDLLCRLGDLVAKSKNATETSRAVDILDPADMCRPSSEEEAEGRILATKCEQAGKRWLYDARTLAIKYPLHVVTILSLIIPSDPTMSKLEARYNSHQLWSGIRSDDVSSRLLSAVLTGTAANLLEVALLHSDKHFERCTKLRELLSARPPSVTVDLPDNISEQSQL